MEQFEGIRRDSRDQGMSIRALAKRHGVHRRTVRQALADATPPARKLPQRVAPTTGPYVDLVRRWLIEDQAAPKKQRHTARRVWQRLVEEEDARVGESTVRNLVARLRTEIGADRCQVMVPQTHPPAAEAEVDFGEFTASIAGTVMKLYMFVCGCRIQGRRSTSAMPTKPRNLSWMGMCAPLKPSVGCRPG